MRVTLRTNIPEIRGMFAELFRDQIPFAAVGAINDTAFAARDEIRTGIRERFTIRRQWVVQGIQVPRGGKATKRRPVAIVEVEHRRRFLVKFEEGGVKTGTQLEPIAIPTEHIRPTQQAIPPRRLYPKNLGLAPRRDISGGTINPRIRVTRGGFRRLVGKYRTFVLDPSEMTASTWGIFQRTGPRRQDIRLIWAYRRQIPIPAILEFVQTATRVVKERFEKFFGKRFDQAIRSARL